MHRYEHSTVGRMIAIACAVIVLLGGTVGCGVSAQSQKEHNHLTIAWWGSQSRNDRQKKVNDLFSTSHSDTVIDGQFSQYADYWQKLATDAAGSQLPDIIAMDLPYLDQYVSNGLLMDLTPYVENGTIDLSHVTDATVESGTSENGALYAIPSGLNAPSVIYDKTLLDSIGVTVPNNWTVEDFESICREVYAKTGVKTNAGYYRDANVLEYQLRAHSTRLYEDGNIAVSAEHVEPYFSIFQNGIEEGWHLDPTIFTEINLSVINQDPLVAYDGADNRSWCNFGWSNSLSGLQSLVTNGDELALAPWPSDDVSQSNYVHPAMFFAISRDCKNPQLAAQWLDFYINDAQANEIMSIDRGMPINTTMVDNIKDSLNEADLASIDYVQDVVEPSSTPINAPAPAKSAEINSAVMPLIQEKLLYRKIDAAQASNEFIAMATTALQ